MLDLRARLARDGRLGAAPWWVWVGGCFGAFYVLGSVVTAPKLGAAALFAFILAGQAVASLAVDHFGWVGFDENPVTPGRLLGLALVAAGVARGPLPLACVNRLSTTGPLVPGTVR